MSDDLFPDPATPFGERVRRRLHDDVVIWLTTVGTDGTPQPNPVWFIAEGDSVLVYNRPDSKRLTHIRRNPRVAFNFDGDGRGGDIIVLSGRADIVANEPPSDQNPSYVDKYRDMAAEVSGDVAAFAQEYSIAIRVTLDRVRGF